MWSRFLSNEKKRWRRKIKYDNLNVNNRSLISENRVIYVPSQCNSLNIKYVYNRISTQKYSLWTFLPKNLFEQFRRVANLYFLISSMIILIIDSPISPFTSLLPLLFVISVTACKQGYEDYLRYRLDLKTNNTLVTVIRNKCLQEIKCQDIEVGDLIKVDRDHDVPCDTLLFYSTEKENCCYIMTANLDGETNLKNYEHFTVDIHGRCSCFGGNNNEDEKFLHAVDTYCETDELTVRTYKMQVFYLKNNRKKRHRGFTWNSIEFTLLKNTLNDNKRITSSRSGNYSWHLYFIAQLVFCIFHFVTVYPTE